MELPHTTNTDLDMEEATGAAHESAPVDAHASESSDGHELKHELTLYAEPVTSIGSFTVTNALLTSWAAVLVIAILAVALRFSIKKVPGKLQQVFEVVIEQGLKLADQVTNDRRISEKAFPFVICFFFFILINNWLGLLPIMGLGVVHHGDTFIPFLRSGTADLNGTIALAVTAVVSSNIFGIVAIGGWKMLNKYINLKALGSIFTKIRKDPVILMVAPVTFAVGLIEIVGEVAKTASLSLRLFGNIFAGEVLLVSMGAILAYFVPIPFIFLEIFVGVIQAFIFGILTLVYFTIAAQDHDHDEEHGDHDPHPDEHGAHILDEIPSDMQEEAKQRTEHA